MIIACGLFITFTFVGRLVHVLSVTPGQVRTISANERRRCICIVFSHWLRTFIWGLRLHLGNGLRGGFCDTCDKITHLWYTWTLPYLCNKCFITIRASYTISPYTFRTVLFAKTRWHQTCNDRSNRKTDTIKNKATNRPLWTSQAWDNEISVVDTLETIEKPTFYR